MKVCYKYIGVRVPGTTIPIDTFIICPLFPLSVRVRTLNALIAGLQNGGCSFG